MNGIADEQIPAPSWCECNDQQICEQHLALGIANEASSEDVLYDLWVRSDEPVKLRPDQLLAFQKRLDQPLSPTAHSDVRIRRIAACIRDSFAEGLDEGVSMDIARRIAALPDEAAAPSPTVARREAVRQSIIRQISDNGPDLDQTKLPAADWNVVLASLGPSPAKGSLEDRVDTVWSLLIEAGDEGSRYTAEKIVEALAILQPAPPPHRD